MSQTLPVNGFKWDEHTSQFDEAILKKIMKYTFFRLMFNIQKSYMNIEKVENCMIKKNVFFIRYIKQVLNHGLILKKVIESLKVFKKPG